MMHITMSATDNARLCRSFKTTLQKIARTITATAVACFLAGPLLPIRAQEAGLAEELVSSTVVPLDCTHTQGYWKNHFEEWPTTGLTLGTVPYTNAQLLQILNTEPAGNGLIELAHQLISAKLNVALGADASCIAATIASADALIGNKVVPPIGTGFLLPSETGALSMALDQFNNGNSACGQCFQRTNVLVVKTAPAAPVAIGAGFQYMISACNNSMVAADDVVVTDTLPACASYVSATPAPVDAMANPLRWNLGTLEPGQCRHITINVTAQCHTNDCVNTATVSTVDPETTYEDNVDTATVRVIDNIPPDITCPPNRELECPRTTAQKHPDVLGYATATDNCGIDDITYSDISQNLCGDSSVTTRTWTATDTSGNTDSCQQIITVRDTTPPTLTCPNNITVPGPTDSSTCVEVTYPPATASDTCGDVTVRYSPPSGTCFPCGTVTTVNVTATDECGNVSRCSFTVTVGPCPSNGCSLTQGYWKTHPEDWPIENIDLGTQSYTKAEALEILNQPVKGNGLVSLAHQLIAAKLNVANGADDSCIAATIAAADALIGSKLIPPHSTESLKTNAVSSLVSMLNSYNNGYLCVPHCSGLEPDPVQVSAGTGDSATVSKKAAKQALKAEKKAAKAAKKAAKNQP